CWPSAHTMGPQSLPLLVVSGIIKRIYVCTRIPTMHPTQVESMHSYRSHYEV
ncbi:uncharacterized protein METZ01_LOCUS310459, partial [marine metagenome]